MKNKNILNKKVSLDDLELFVQELEALFKKPQVLFLKGPLGVGKTTLVRVLLKKNNNRHWNIQETDQVSSPAFAVQHVYSSSYGKIYHLDLYRLKNDEDLESTGFWDIFSEPKEKYLIIIEWADRLNLSGLSPMWNYLNVTLSFGKQKNIRNIKVDCIQ